MMKSRIGDYGVNRRSSMGIGKEATVTESYVRDACPCRLPLRVIKHYARDVHCVDPCTPASRLEGECACARSQIDQDMLRLYAQALQNNLIFLFNIAELAMPGIIGLHFRKIVVVLAYLLHFLVLPRWIFIHC